MIGEMRQEAERLYRLAVAAADPEAAVRAALERKPQAGPVRVLALGKAGVAMARSALAVLGDRVREALVITNAENAAELPGAELVIGGHPVPDAGSERAGQAVEALLTRLCPGEVLLALISGGGSALMAAPVAGVTLEEKAAVSRLLLGAGLDITGMNMVRQHLSRLKGGGLLRLAGSVPVEALILSDVVGDDLAVIASGPTVAPIAPRAEVRDMLRARGLWTALPASVRHALERAEPEAALPAAANRLIGSNGQSLAAMAVGGGEIWHARLEGDVSDAADWLVARMKAAPPGPVRGFCGGETTVVLRGAGRGGRNQELALRVAAGMQGVLRPWVFLSGGTDGRDGPTEAAGGLVDGGTLGRIAAAGGDWRALLANNDSHAALSLAGDLLVVGGTGTNVADVQVVLMG